MVLLAPSKSFLVSCSSLLAFVRFSFVELSSSMTFVVVWFASTSSLFVQDTCAKEVQYVDY